MGMAGQVKQGVGLGYGHAHRILGNFDNFIFASDFSLLQHAEVKAGPVMRHKQGRHARFLHPNANPVAGNAGLRHFEQRAPNAIAIANANFVIGEAIYGEVLPELTKGEIISPELLFPVTIRIHLVHEDCAVLSAVTGQIPLAVTVNVKPAYHAAALDRTFPYRRVYGLSLPSDVARETHVNR